MSTAAHQSIANADCEIIHEPLSGGKNKVTHFGYGELVMCVFHYMGNQWSVKQRGAVGFAFPFCSASSCLISSCAGVDAHDGFRSSSCLVSKTSLRLIVSRDSPRLASLQRRCVVRRRSLICSQRGGVFATSATSRKFSVVDTHRDFFFFILSTASSDLPELWNEPPVDSVKRDGIRKQRYPSAFKSSPIYS